MIGAQIPGGIPIGGSPAAPRAERLVEVLQQARETLHGCLKIAAEMGLALDGPIPRDETGKVPDPNGLAGLGNEVRRLAAVLAAELSKVHSRL